MRFLIPTLIAALISSPALSCGNPLLWAMLFKRVPAAELVFDADLLARENGSLQPRVYEPDPTAPSDYHRWSMQWIKDVAVVVDEDMQANLSTGETFTLLLADAVVAIHFTSGNPPRVTSSGGLDFFTGFDAITTVNALESGLNHGLTMTEMVELGVWASTERAKERRIAGIF